MMREKEIQRGRICSVSGMVISALGRLSREESKLEASLGYVVRWMDGWMDGWMEDGGRKGETKKEKQRKKNGGDFMQLGFMVVLW
jgi:hypothetical protein